MKRYTYISETKSFAVGDRSATLNQRLNNLRDQFAKENSKDEPDRSKLNILSIKQDIVKLQLQGEQIRVNYEEQIDRIAESIDQKKAQIERIKANS